MVVRAPITRREFLAFAAASAACAAGPRCGGSASAAAVPMRPDAGTVAAAGVKAGAPEAEIERAVREAALAASDLSWLSKGDRVLLKPASNSANPFPATTSPRAIRAVTRLLLERGASKVVVADQAGVEAVHPRTGSTRGSTREVMRENGLLGAAEEAGAEVFPYEEAGYGAYFEAQPPEGSHWRDGLFLPQVLKEIDHVVYVPRVSRHMLAGTTLALKSAVGWLREDSRLELHRDASTFLEKCAEITAAQEIRSKLRLVLSDGTRVLATRGPDSGYEVEPETGLVLASTDIVAHDLAALSYLLSVRDSLPFWPHVFDPYPGLASAANRAFVGMIWGMGEGVAAEGYDAPEIETPWDCRVLVRGMELWGGAPAGIEWTNVGGSVPEGILADLKGRIARGGS